jgi:hypothetical protein
VKDLTDDSQKSLRQAIIDADNSTDASSTITFDSSLTGTITLESALPALKKNITITGAGWGNVSVVRDTTKLAFQIFNIAKGTTCEIDGLFIGSGSSPSGGGGVVNAGNLTLDGCTIANNTGGGIFNVATGQGNGSLTLTGCSVYGNSNPGQDGGGIENVGGVVYISNSEIYGNSAQDGGGIWNSSGSGLYIGQSDIFGNTATGNGGGIYNAGTLGMTSGTLSSNSAAGNGGGLYLAGGTATLTSVSIQGNGATGATSKGGGFYLNTGNLTLNGITISGNTAATGPGGTWNSQPGGSLTINNPVSITDAIVKLS